MSNMGPGDVGIEVTLKEQQAVDGAKRVAQALDELDKTTIKMGADLDKAMNQATAAITKAAEATRQLTAEEKVAFDAARKAYDEHQRAVTEQKKATEEAAGALDTFKNRLAAISSERAAAFAGMGDQLRDLQKQVGTAQAGGDVSGANQAKQQIITIQQDIVRSQKDALSQMLRDGKLSNDQYVQVMQARDKAEQELRNLEVAAHKSAELEKVAASKQAAQQQAEASKQAAEAAKQAAQQQKQALHDLKQGLMQVGVAAAAMSYAIKKAMDEALDAFKEQQTALKGLESMSTAMSKNFSDAKAAAQDLTNDGLLPIATTAKAIQNLLGAGFNVDQAKELVQIAKDAAAFNSKGGREMADAVVQFSEGIRMGNARMTQAAGLSERLTTILKRQGIAQSELQNLENDSAARAVILNGLREAGAQFTGDAARAVDTLTGAEARNTTTTLNAKVAWGEALAPAMQSAYASAQPLLEAVMGFAKTNPELARTIMLVAAGAVTFTAAIAGLTVALIALNAVMGPVGWALLGVGALAGYASSIAVTGAAAQHTKQQLSELTTQYDDLKAVVQDTTRSEEDRQKASDELRKVIQQIKDINPGLIQGFQLQREELNKLNDSLDHSVSLWNRLKDFMQQAWPGMLNGMIPGAGFFSDKIKQLIVGKTPAEQLADSRKELEDLQTEAADYLKSIESTPDAEAHMLQKYGPRLKAAQEKVNSLSKGSWDKSITASEETPFELLPPSDDKKDGGGGSGTHKMSAALQAAMDDLKDLEALDKTPENLRRTLAKVREIIKQHTAELKELGKDREMIRLRDITLPKELEHAEFTSDMRQLNTKEQLKQLNPAQLKEGLQKIQKDFAAYLEQHPDEALQLDLRVKGASEAEIKAPLERWKTAFQEAEKLGLSLDEKLHALKAGLSLAAAAGDTSAMFDLAGQIKQVDAAMRQARFDEQFKAIAEARENAFAGAAGDLAKLDMQLADEEEKGAKTDPAKVAALKQQMLDAVKPALEAQKTALEKLLASITGQDTESVKQREQVEKELTSVKGQLYNQDVQAHKIALDAKTAAERSAADTKAKLIQQEQQWIKEAATEDMRLLHERNKAAEDVQQDRIKGLQSQLTAMERMWAAEDRRKHVADLQQQLANVKADVGPQFEKILADGTRVFTYDEAKAADLEKQIADAKQQNARDQQRQALQDQISAAQASLEAMREDHRAQEAERQRFWTFLESLDLTKYDDLTKAAAKGMGEWAKALNTALDQAKLDAQTKANEIKGILEGITNLTTPKLPPLTPPTLPASLAGSTGAANAGNTTITIGSVALPNVANPGQFLKELPYVAQAAGVDVRNVLRGAQVIVNGLT